MKEYTIISGYQVADVIRKVNEHLKEGWELCGNLTVGATPDRDGDFYAQAMTKALPSQPGEWSSRPLGL